MPHEDIYEKMPAPLLGQSNMAAAHTPAPSLPPTLPNRQKLANVSADPQLHVEEPQEECVEPEPENKMRNIEQPMTPTPLDGYNAQLCDSVQESPINKDLDNVFESGKTEQNKVVSPIKNNGENLSYDDILPKDLRKQPNSAAHTIVPPSYQMSGEVHLGLQPDRQEIARAYETIGKLLYLQSPMKFVANPTQDSAIPKRTSSEDELHQPYENIYDEIGSRSCEPQVSELPKTVKPSKLKSQMKLYENIYDEPRDSTQPRMVKPPTPKPRAKPKTGTSSGIIICCYKITTFNMCMKLQL